MGNVIDVSQNDFQKQVIEKSHTAPVIVDFWAPWCGPCRMLGPVLEKVANEPNSGFTLAKLNTDQNQAIAMQYGIRGIPAVKAFVNGRVVDEFVGAQPEPMVRQFLGRLPKSGGNGQPAAAESPEAATDPTARLAQARQLLKKGKGCEAQTQLTDFPNGPGSEAAQKLRPLADFLCTMGRPSNGQTGQLDQDYQRVASDLQRGQYSTALYNLLALLRQDKNFRNGQARQVMLAVFELLGDDHDLTRAYRSQLASVLF